jgi:hypothetical protein
MALATRAQQPENLAYKGTPDALSRQQLGKYLQTVNQRASTAEQEIARASVQYVGRLSTIEARLLKLAKLDTLRTSLAFLQSQPGQPVPGAQLLQSLPYYG